MTEIVDGLFELSDRNATQKARTGVGILPYQAIKALAYDKEIVSRAADIESDQYQPASLDLRLGSIAYRVRASFLPGPTTKVADKLRQIGAYRVELGAGAVLERGSVYIVPLMEELQLSSRISAFANPKSSTGRLDIFTRVITDEGTDFDRVPPGYSGLLYAEIAPRTFSVLVRQGTRLSQMRFSRGTSTASQPPTAGQRELKRLQEETGIVTLGSGIQGVIRGGRIGVTVDLVGGPGTRVVGWRAKRHTDVIDVDKKSYYEPFDYWDPIESRSGRNLVLDPAEFYILATRESVSVPPDYAAEMIAYEAISGEFRVHYAGFFDPGFGNGPDAPASKAVLEVRCHDVPFILEHGQIVGWLQYERLTHRPDRAYGTMLGSHYQGQGLALGKQFRPAFPG